MTKTAIDIFCGSGAVTWALKQSGFRVASALDIDATACATYQLNHPEVPLFEADVRKIDVRRFQTVCTDAIDVLAICAPCQPFSSQNRYRTTLDTRAELILSCLPLIVSFRPILIFLENVPGFGRGHIARKFIAQLEALGYFVGPLSKIDAANFGVPQRRRRVMLIAADKSRCSWKKAYQLAKRPKKSVADALRNLPPAADSRQQSSLQDPLHYARKHHAITLERLRHIPKDGGSRESLPPYLQLKCHKSVGAGSFPDTYSRMAWDDVAPTLTTGCTDVTRGRYAHPEHDRAITLREAARLQTFPDDYKFAGNAAQVAAQIGNAVPPQMMVAIGEALASAVEIT